MIFVFAHDIPLRAEIQIGKFNRFAIGHTESPIHTSRLGKPSRIPAFAASARVDRFIVGIIGSARRLRQILSRADAGINQPLLPQLPPGPKIMPSPLTLRVWTVLLHHSRDLRSSRAPATADLPSSPEQIPPASAVDLNPRSAKSKFHGSRSRAALRSRRFEHGRYEEVRSATAPSGPDNDGDPHEIWPVPGSQKHSKCPQACCMQHAVFRRAHRTAAPARLSRVGSTSTELGLCLRYPFRLRQPQRGLRKWQR